MRAFFFILKLFFVFLTFNSCVSKKTIAKTNDYVFFAELKNNLLVFKVDTVQYKNFIKTELFAKESIYFQKIDIVKHYMIGSKKVFYYLSIEDKINGIKVAKWLDYIDGKFYSKMMIEEGDLFEQSYLVCRGVDGCSPNVLEVDGIKHWGCSEEVSCFVDKDAATKFQEKCKSFKSVIMSEK
ncbi:hypothetical protein [Flavobacterium sp.]|jgi:hypothetical protein|uniref:hypothetical protein n=1 Tax=Flavobacterium sp. TaxID=239 RepID=UPI0037BFAAC3